MLESEATMDITEAYDGLLKKLQEALAERVEVWRVTPLDEKAGVLDGEESLV